MEMFDKMEMIKILKPDFFFGDERGTLTQITHESFAQVNHVFTVKGAVRGNFHYHKRAKEVFFVASGDITVYLEKGDKSEKYNFKTGDMFLIREDVRHRFDFNEDTHLVAFYTERVELPDGTKDIYTD